MPTKKFTSKHPFKYSWEVLIDDACGGYGTRYFPASNAVATVVTRTNKNGKSFRYYVLNYGGGKFEVTRYPAERHGWHKKYNVKFKNAKRVWF